MLFIMGMSQGKKYFDFSQMIICDHCGSYGRYQVFMTYMYLSIFFIPLLKWNRQYYVKSSCCDTVYALDTEIGRAIARGENVEILPEHLTKVQAGHRIGVRKCENCGYETQEDFDYCPKCGQRF